MDNSTVQKKKLQMEDLLKINLYATIVATIVFFILELIVKKYVAAGILILLGGSLVSFVWGMKNRLSFETRITITSLGQFAMILTASLIVGSVADMFALFLATNIMGGIYFNKRVILIHGLLVNLCILLLVVFAYQTAFGSTEIATIFKNLFGLNFGIFFAYTLVKWGGESMQSAASKTQETQQLLVTIQDKIQESDALISSQQDILDKIQGCSADIANTSGKISSVSERIRSGIVSQANAIHELSASFDNFSQQIHASADAVQNAETISVQTGKEMEQGWNQMDTMLVAMKEITNASEEIRKVMKSVDDIAFQTNILALNASVEAARAGAAGKGFAVVADEVRMLASRSADSSQITAKLVGDAVDAINKGTSIAQKTAKTFQMVMESEKNTRELMKDIFKLAEKQKRIISQITQGIDQISQVVQQNSQAVDESTQISTTLENQADFLLQIARKSDSMSIQNEKHINIYENSPVNE